MTEEKNRFKFKKGYLVKKDGSIWYNLYTIERIASSNEDLNSLREKAKIYYKDDKCYCKSCNQDLNYTLISGDPHIKLCECLKKD